MTKLATFTNKACLKINTKKTELKKINNKVHPIQMVGTDIKERQNFLYLGSFITIDGGAEEDVNVRIN